MYLHPHFCILCVKEYPMNLKYLILSMTLLTVPVVSSLIAACDDDELDYEESSEGVCMKERGDGRCNVNSDCCSGRECSSFGFCQNRT